MKQGFGKIAVEAVKTLGNRVSTRLLTLRRVDTSLGSPTLRRVDSPLGSSTLRRVDTPLKPSILYEPVTSRKFASGPSKLGTEAPPEKKVKMGEALFLKSGESYKVTSGPLTFCSFGVIEIMQDEKVLGNLFVHHGSNKVSELNKNIISTLKNNINRDTVKVRLTGVQTAQSTEHRNTPTTIYDGIEGYKRDTHQELLLDSLRVIFPKMDYTFGSQIAPSLGSEVNVTEEGRTQFASQRGFWDFFSF